MMRKVGRPKVYSEDEQKSVKIRSSVYDSLRRIQDSLNYRGLNDVILFLVKE